MLPWLWLLEWQLASLTAAQASIAIWQHWNAFPSGLTTSPDRNMPSLTPEREEACLRFGLFLINEQEHGNDEAAFLRLLNMYQRNFSKRERRWMTEKWVEIREAAVAMKLDHMKRFKERGGMFG